LTNFLPNWQNFAQIGAQKSTMGRISANLDDIRLKSVVKIKLRAFDSFEMNFGQN
jgi:hypothetical protein